MAKAAKATKVEAAIAASPTPEPPSCLNCRFKINSGGYFLCQIKLPPWVRRTERASAFLVRPTDVCDLHQGKS
jgi:hypothetical protein